jgi:hypothetical protein
MTEGTQQPPVVAYRGEAGESLTKYDLGTLAVRLFGLYCLANALTFAAYLPGILLYPPRGATWGGLLATVGAVPGVVFVLAGVLLLARTRWVVRRVFPEFAAGTGLSATGRDLQAVLFSAVGVWLVASTLPEAARLVMEYWSTGGSVPTMARRPLTPETVGVIVELAAGVFLFVGARGTSALWHRLRYAGVQQGPTP